MKMEAESRVMLPQTEKYPGLPVVAEAKKDPASRTVREYISVVLSHLVCGCLLQLPLDTNIVHLCSVRHQLRRLEDKRICFQDGPHS